MSILGHDLVGSFLITQDSAFRSARSDFPILIGCNIPRRLPPHKIEAVVCQPFMVEGKRSSQTVVEDSLSMLSVNSEEVLPPHSVRRVACNVNPGCIKSEVLVRNSLQGFDPSVCAVKGSQ